MSATSTAPMARDIDPAPPTAVRYAPRGPLATQALVIALELGVLGDSVMRVNGFGINITLWCLVALGCTVALTVANGIEIDRRRALLIAAAGFFALVPSWRAAEELVVLSSGALFVLLVLLAWTGGAPSVALSRAPIGSYLRALFTAAQYGLRGPLPLIAAESETRTDLRERYRRPTAAVLRGLVIGLPILLVFGALLVSADVAFESLVVGLLAWDTQTVVSHLVVSGIFTWIAAAYLCAATTSWRERAGSGIMPRLGVIEAGTVLALVNLLFLSFMLVQLRYLFGGADVVLATAGLSYADYARRGFFELVAVAALALPLLIAVTSLVRSDSAGEARALRGLAGALVVLLLLLVSSALGRMRLYQGMYGWTMDRLFATTFMLWIAGSIVWFAGTTLRGQANRFTFGSVVGGLGLLAGFIVMNPAAVVVKANANRIKAGREFDGAYAAGLRADGIPTLLALLPRIGPVLDDVGRCSIERTVADVLADERSANRWQTWNLGREKAARAVRDHRDAVRDAVGLDPCSAVDARAREAAAGTAPTGVVPPGTSPPPPPG